MSELKGQLLGIVLVLSLFATISTCVAKAFSDYTTKINAKTNEIAETIAVDTDGE